MVVVAADAFRGSRLLWRNSLELLELLQTARSWVERRLERRPLVVALLVVLR